MSGLPKWLMLSLALLWCFAGALQYNDPDPLPWLVVYLAGAAFIAVAAFKPTAWMLPVGMAVGVLPWCLAIGPELAFEVPWEQFVGQVAMASETVEQAREAWGLLLLAMSLLLAAFIGWRNGGEDSG